MELSQQDPFGWLTSNRVAPGSICFAQGKAAMARELVEFVSRRFGKEVAEEGTEVFARKVESLLVTN